MCTLYQSRASRIPEGSKPHAGNNSIAEVFFYRTRAGRPGAICFLGKKSKASCRYEFPNESVMETQMDLWMSEHQQRHRNQTERNLASVPAPGTILCSSWGYEQTNVCFYRVEEVSRLQLKLIELAKTDVSTDDDLTMQGKVIPVSQPKEGAKAFRRQWREGISIESYEWAKIWDGQPQKYTSYA